MSRITSPVFPHLGYTGARRVRCLPCRFLPSLALSFHQPAISSAIADTDAGGGNRSDRILRLLLVLDVTRTRPPTVTGCSRTLLQTYRPSVMEQSLHMHHTPLQISHIIYMYAHQLACSAGWALAQRHLRFGDASACTVSPRCGCGITLASPGLLSCPSYRGGLEPRFALHC